MKHRGITLNTLPLSPLHLFLLGADGKADFLLPRVVTKRIGGIRGNVDL